MLAAAAGHLAVVRYLVPHVSTRVSALSTYGTFVDGGYHALMWASYSGHQDVAAFLLTQGSGSGKIEINPPKPLGAVRGEGYAPLHFAAIADQTEMVGFLLERGADIHVRVSEWFIVWKHGVANTFKRYGASPLTLAASEGHIETLRVLLDHWVKTYGTDGRDDHGRTTLMYAAAAGDTDTMAALVAEGAPVNAQTHTGATALMFAAHEGHADAVALLLEMGADTHHTNQHNATALMLAQENGHTTIVVMLESLG
ncbi:MAG: ankyrin repeat domain-containing protein [Gemmatimonadota bacterium]|nr:ankyrin repeat domain-containing protein [Gemmatimonadota bacterium]